MEIGFSAGRLFFSLVDGKYEVRQFRDGESIVSPTFPGLQLTLNQVLDAADGEA